jgi:hypothetical protein
MRQHIIRSAKRMILTLTKLIVNVTFKFTKTPVFLTFYTYYRNRASAADCFANKTKKKYDRSTDSI